MKGWIKGIAISVVAILVLIIGIPVGLGLYHTYEFQTKRDQIQRDQIDAATHGITSSVLSYGPIKQEIDDYDAQCTSGPATSSTATPSTDTSSSKANTTTTITNDSASSQSTVVNVYLKTHIYTIFDQAAQIRVYDPSGTDYRSVTITVPASGGVIQSITIPNGFIPEGHMFNVCVINERYGKEDCSGAIRNPGSMHTDVSMTLP